ncbi:hypothetical protein BDV25DRAFT_135683 [Aspergillus avenaceus]|uniref:Armadillo-type protein n=1 Tax=Aspergillus avenaceus TaxID=36643 RepID=A0A5N6U7Z9_ASPAV|nr:hypothetical protein BDV25DRAFT_135683 [Aspergillus avenaceus]
MEELRLACRGTLSQNRPASTSMPEVQADNIALPDGLNVLWEDVSSLTDTSSHGTCESLLVAKSFLELRGPQSLSGDDKCAANGLYEWASAAALPSAVYAQTEEVSNEHKEAMREDQLRSRLALAIIASLNGTLPIADAKSQADIIIALASFSSTDDPWTTQESHECSTKLLDGFAKSTHSLWSILEQILKERIRPLFAKAKNPAITAAGRKNFHPVPLPRFDASILDPETKPWKIHDVYAPTVFSWIITQYNAQSITNLETHFPLLIPPLLSLIDDENTLTKATGCKLLTHLLTPIKESNSPILHRTNLSPVFSDAIKPSLLSLPSITPENDSIALLQKAYPALLSLHKTTHATNPNKHQYTQELAKTLRDHLIPSFHHISSTNTTSGSSFASFPYPLLSTLLLDNTVPVLTELGIHSTKYLQDLIPLLHNTLVNPFGPAYPPLLLAALAVTRAVILNAHPRVWRWRGEVLSAVCSCWIHAVDEEVEIEQRRKKDESSGSRERDAMEKVKKELRGVVYLLKFAVRNSVQDEDVGQVEARENLDGELVKLVDADECLRGLLLEEVDVNDKGYFGSC